jgi:hypothetical protein
MESGFIDIRSPIVVALLSFNVAYNCNYG